MAQQRGIYHLTDTGYIYDKRFFWGIIVISLLIAIFVFNQHGWDFSPKFYFKCDYPGPCDNPMYNGHAEIFFREVRCLEDWCMERELPAGVYGEKAPEGIFRYFSMIVLGLAVLALVLNHVTHNRGKTFSVKINLPDKWLRKIEETTEKIGGKMEDE